MLQKFVLGVTAGVCLAAAAPQQPDFAKDIAPIFKQNCNPCHGPAQQIAGLRLDRRSSVFKNGMRRVVPGSSENSFLYHRVSGTAYGMQMPPSGPLRPEQIALIKAWIEQGAPWPDSLANEADLPPVNAKAVAAVEMLRTGDRQGFLKAIAEDAKLLNARGPGGASPFMYSVLYSDTATLETLLKKGADANFRSDANASPLMWTATSLEKTRLLLAHGAAVNVMSDAGRTPLMLAASKPGGSAVVKLLLDHGANPNPTRNPMGESSPLLQATIAADPQTMQLLVEHGAKVKDSGMPGLMYALAFACAKCADIYWKEDLGKDAYTFVLLNAATDADAATIRKLLDRGAEINAVDPFGHSPLMMAAASDLGHSEAVKLLLDRGAAKDFKSRRQNSGDASRSVIDTARMHGQASVIDVLAKAGAGSGEPLASAPPARRAASLRGAIERSLPLIQRGAANFSAKSGCISCHNSNLAAIAVGMARKAGFSVDERTAAEQVKVNAAYIEHQRDELLQAYFPAQAGAEAFGEIFGPGVLGYVLIGLDAERYQPDLNTDAVAIYLKNRQMADGRWAYTRGDNRQPLCQDYITQTALAMHALQLYAPKPDRAEYEKSIQLAASWIAQAQPGTNADVFAKLMGLAWAGKDKNPIAKVSREVVALQHADGGWSDVAGLESNAYATGQALYALHAAGLPASDKTWQRGIEYLMNTQMEDGSWFVRTRALALQPYFDAGFPHGVHQFISAAGSAWATIALTLAAEVPPPLRTGN
jgi:N-acyl-D-amino-acid deacylase